MKIYTKKGDTGKTALIGGTRVSKHHIRVESYGNVDELNVAVGFVSSSINDQHTKEILNAIQNILFTIGSYLASDPQKSKMKLPELKEKEITVLEKEMDAMEAELPPLKNFVLPGGNLPVSFCHLARVVCRRAERSVSRLMEENEVDPLILKYLNRLSDYFFVLSRKIAIDTGAPEVPWIPGRV